MRGRVVIPGAAILAAAILGGAFLAGCSTKRVLTIHSDPPGARVFVNGEDRGLAPVDVSFVHYGELDVRLEKPGYASLAGDLVVPTQSDGYPVVDLPQELVVRERRFHWTGRLRPVDRAPSEEDARATLARARALRERTLVETREPGTPGRIREGFPWDNPVPAPRVPSPPRVGPFP